MSVSAERAGADVADVLDVEVGDLDPEMDLRDQGMDSVRLMDLVERWRRAGLEQIDFIALAEDQRLVHWLDVLNRLQGDGGTTP